MLFLISYKYSYFKPIFNYTRKGLWKRTLTFRIFEYKGMQGLGFQMRDLVLCCIVALSEKVVSNSYGLSELWKFWPQSHTSNRF
jgi:hypothetical protein